MNLIRDTGKRTFWRITSVKVPGTKGQFEILKRSRTHRFIALQRW